MKKLFALLLVLALFASALAGCAKTPASNEPTKLTLILRGGTYADVIKAALPEFEKANNCTCEVLDLSFADLHDKIMLDAVNKQGAYDLCMVDGSWMAEFTANGVLENLTGMGYKYDDDIIPATTVAGVASDGNVYMIPYFGNVTVFMYNKALLGSNPVPGSWEEVYDIASKVNSGSTAGYLLRAQAGDNIVSDFLPVLLAHGGWVFNEDNTKVTVNTPEFKNALEYYIKLYGAGKILDKDDIVAAIDGGTAAMALGWPGWYVPKTDGPATYTVIPTRLEKNGKELSTSIYGCWFVGMAANSQHKDLTLKLLEYVTGKDVQLASIANGGVPCRKSCLLNADVLKEKPHLETVYNALQVGVYRPLIAQWNDVTLALGAELDNAVQGVKTVDKALADAQTAIEGIMK